MLRDGSSGWTSQGLTRLKVDISKRFQDDFKMVPIIQDGPIQETGPLAVCEGSARLKMMPF